MCLEHVTLVRNKEEEFSELMLVIKNVSNVNNSVIFSFYIQLETLQYHTIKKIIK